MRKAFIITAIVSLLLFLPVGILIDSRYENHLFHEQNSQVQDELTRKTTVLGNVIQKRFALLEGLHAFVLANPNPEQLDAKFSIFAAALQTGTSGIRNFGLSPEGLNAYVFPLKGNEKAIGHSLIDDYRPNVKADVQRAIKSQKITLSGPYQLRQGGLGLVARKAVFRGDDFWGLSTMVVDMPPVLLEAGLASPLKNDPFVAIRNASGKTFYGSEQLFSTSSLVERIILPDGAWEMVMQTPKTLLPPFAQQLHIFRFLSSLVGALLLVLVYSISSRQTYLIAKVKEQTLHLEEELDERRKVEQALSESEQRLRELIESSPIGLALCAMDGSLLSVNPAYAEIIGHSVEDTLKLSYWDVTPEKYTHQEKEQLAQLETMGRYGPYEKEYRHKDGHLVPVRLNGMIIIRDGEKCIWSSVEDISALKEAEAAKSELADQLRQSQKLEAIGTLAGGVAHDFNNMLGVILGHTEMALEETDPASPLYADLHTVHQAAERSSALTRQLLAFARKQTIAPKVIDMNDTVVGMLNMLRRLIGEDIDLLWQPGINLRPVKVDPSQLDQLLANLCVNARDAIAGVGKITIETHAKTFDEAYCADHLEFQPGEYILLEVSDNGCGMDKKTLNQIFEPFFTTREMGQGTGLGLASVFGMVKQNNGFINVYSEPGQGTTFKIYLPPYAIKSDGVVEKEPDLPAEHGNETILLVEDESAILEMTTRMLERLGYTVVAATTPGEAIRLAHEYRGRIDLLLTDVVMPEMNGRQLAGNLLSHYPDLKRLFMSGYTANVIAHHGVLDEGVHFIQKPFSMKDLGGKLREALKG